MGLTVFIKEKAPVILRLHKSIHKIRKNGNLYKMILQSMNMVVLFIYSGLLQFFNVTVPVKSYYISLIRIISIHLVLFDI